MAKDKYYGKTLRKNFARHEEVMAMPNLLEIQKRSYKWFLETGLREVFADVASITDYAGNLELSFIDYSMDEKPKYDVEECKARDATYAAPMKVRVRLHNKETGEIKEQEIFMGDFPLMTHGGTFVINGAERVVVSQIVRSPGVYYGKEIDLKTDLPLLTSTVIPYRGAWLEYETDTSEVFWVRIDKNRKLPITCLIRALGLKTDGEILERFGDDRRIVATLEKDTCKTYEEALLEIYRKLRPGEPPTVDSAETLLQGLFFDPRRYDLSMVGRYKFNKKLTIWSRAKGQKLAMPVANPATGEIIFEDGHMLTAADCAELDAVGVYEITVALESGETLKIFTNKMCDMSRYVDFDPKEQCGIKERVRFDVLQELLGQYSGEELIAQCRLHADELVPKHIIVDDIFASINYMNALARGLVNKDDIDTWVFFRWVFKTAAAVLIVSNTWNIVMGVFEAAQSVVNRASGLIVGNTSINLADHIADLEARLLEMNVWTLLGLWLQSFVVGFSMWALTICIFIIIYGRMIEIYLVTSIAPIPMATMMGKEWGGMGQNYLRSLLALAFQGFLIIICIAIYAVLVQNMLIDDNISTAIWLCMGYTVLLCFTLFKTSSLAKSIFNSKR